MPSAELPDLDAAFFALSDPTRRLILERLGASEAKVTDLAEPFDISLPAVSKHLRVLEAAGLLQRRVSGRQHFLRANFDPLVQVRHWIERQRAFWEGSLDRLADHLEGLPATTSSKNKRSTKATSP